MWGGKGKEDREGWEMSQSQWSLTTRPQFLIHMGRCHYSLDQHFILHFLVGIQITILGHEKNAFGEIKQQIFTKELKFKYQLFYSVEMFGRTHKNNDEAILGQIH